MTTRLRPPVTALELDTGRLCEAIEARRLLRGLTQHRLADELGVDYTTMCVWRRGRGGMHADVALRIALWLDIDLRDYARLARDAA